jgi:hypothetical protein
MRTHPGIVAVFVIGLISVSLPCLGGTILSTERSVEELKLMTTPELAGEARSVCGGIVASMKNAQEWSAEGTKRRDSKFHDNARKESELAAAGRRYLERIGLVIRDRQHGQMPPWFEAMTASKTQEACDAAATAGGWRPKP